MAERYLLIGLSTCMITLPGCLMGQLAFELTSSISWAIGTISAFALSGFLLGCYAVFGRRDVRKSM